jgi:hypothetical protein
MTKRKRYAALALLAILLILVVGGLLLSRLPRPEALIDYDASLSPTAPISGEAQATWYAIQTATNEALTQTITPEIRPT